MIEKWRIYAIVILMILSFLDLSLTAYYVHKYKQWQPNKPYKLIELNPLLVFLWSNLGFILGMILGSAIILTLIFVVGKSAHWIIVLLVFLFLSWAMYNHYTNISLLHALIDKYPSGVLPVETFGIVEGSN